MPFAGSCRARTKGDECSATECSACRESSASNIRARIWAQPHRRLSPLRPFGTQNRGGDLTVLGRHPNSQSCPNSQNERPAGRIRRVQNLASASDGQRREDCLHAKLGTPHDLDLHRCKASATDRARSCWHQIDDSATDERPTIVDANHDRTTAASIGDTHKRSKGKRLVGCSHSVRPCDFAVGGSAAGIDRGDPSLRVRGRRRRDTDEGHECSGV